MFVGLAPLLLLLADVAALVPSAQSPTATIGRPLPHLRSRQALPTHLRVRGGDSTPHMSAGVVAQRVCPALGFVLSSALYYSPLPELRERAKKGSLGQFNPLPSALMVIGTTSWLSYALSVKDPWIAATNVPGTLVALAQLVLMLPLMKPGRQLTQVQATVLGGAACSIALWARLIFSGVSASVRSSALGTYATAICIALFAAPLSTISTVVRTRNSKSILATLTASQCANCLLWTVYGVFAAKDVFVWGPNGTGLVLGLIQLALKLAFPSVEEDGPSAAA